MVNVIICEDNIKDREREYSIVKKYMSKYNIECEYHIFEDYNDKFNSIISSKIPFKIYLLDIETPTRSGIDIARQIRIKDTESMIIFLTGHEELGNTILKNNLMILSFINKFDNMESKLLESLSKALQLIKHKNIIRFEDRNILYTINIDDILYITKESNERKTIIKTDYAEIKVNKNLINVYNMLDKRFIQTHRACYINDNRKAYIDRNKRIIMFDNGETIDLLSDKYKKEVGNV